MPNLSIEEDELYPVYEFGSDTGPYTASEEWVRGYNRAGELWDYYQLCMQLAVLEHQYTAVFTVNGVPMPESDHPMAQGLRDRIRLLQSQVEETRREVFQSWPHAPIMDIAGQVRPATNGKDE